MGSSEDFGLHSLVCSLDGQDIYMQEIMKDFVNQLVGIANSYGMFGYKDTGKFLSSESAASALTSCTGMECL